MNSSATPTQSRAALRAVAVMEAVKGLVVFGAGFGLLAARLAQGSGCGRRS